MGLTEQESALKTVRTKYGPTAFTEDTVNYKRVGFKAGSEQVTGMGNTWTQAIKACDKKISKKGK